MDQMIRSGHPSTCGCYLCGLYSERARIARQLTSCYSEEIKLLLRRRELINRIEKLTADIIRDAKRPEPV